jgi:hypothetical protein
MTFKERASDLHRDCIAHLRGLLERYGAIAFDPDADPPIYQLNQTDNHDHVTANSVCMHNGEPYVTSLSTDCDTCVVMTNVAVDLNTDELVELVEYVDQFVREYEKSLKALAVKIIDAQLSAITSYKERINLVSDILRAEVHTIKPLRSNTYTIART